MKENVAAMQTRLDLLQKDLDKEDEAVVVAEEK